MNKTLKTGLLLQAIIIAFFAGGRPVTAWPQTVARNLSDYVGRPVNELLDGLGAPESIALAQQPALVLHYVGVAMHGQAYDVDFAVTGPWVEIMRAAVKNAGPSAAWVVEVSDLLAYMGKSRAEMIMLAGAPLERVAFEWDGFPLENMAFDVIMANEPWRLSCDLENNRVVTINCQYGGEMPVDKVRDFVLKLDAQVLALLNEPVWCLDDAGYDETDPLENRWRHGRLAADERFGLMLQTLVTPEKKYLSLDLTLSDLNAKGFMAREFAVSHLKAIADNWYKETSRYINSGNPARLKILLEARAAR